MGDRAPGLCIVHECPKENEDKAFEAVLTYLSTIDWCDSVGQTDGLKLGVHYTDHEARCGFEDELCVLLDDLECTYEIHADGYLEYDPVIIMGTPSLGRFKSTADHDGNVSLDSLEIDALITGTSGRDDLVEALLRKTGKAWEEYFHCLLNGFPAPTIEEMVAARRKLTRVEEVLADAVSES